ncbi:hypothetical protein C8Q78DRAFT_697483 [Trametes maxima]|nr:hypothetical protein C8Q78DRAFT_697483 [Trametes maxima]
MDNMGKTLAGHEMETECRGQVTVVGGVYWQERGVFTAPSRASSSKVVAEWRHSARTSQRSLRLFASAHTRLYPPSRPPASNGWWYLTQFPLEPLHLFTLRHFLSAHLEVPKSLVSISTYTGRLGDGDLVYEDVEACQPGYRHLAAFANRGMSGSRDTTGVVSYNIDISLLIARTIQIGSPSLSEVPAYHEPLSVPLHCFFIDVYWDYVANVKIVALAIPAAFVS